MVEFNEYLHEYSLQGIHVPSVSELLRPVSGDFECDPRYAERGTTIHNLTDLYDRGLFFDGLADDEIYPYMAAYFDFHDAHDIEVVASEKIVFNPNLLYAGRLDRIWKIDGIRHLTDTKTGSKYKQHLYQVVAYAMAEGGEAMSLSNLYLTPYSHKLVTWKNEDVVYGESMVEALSLIYWDNHRKDRKALEKIIGEAK